MATQNGTLGTGISVAATQIVLGQYIRNGATPLEAIGKALKMYEEIRGESDEPITPGEEARTEYLKGELNNILIHCSREDVEEVEGLIVRADTLMESVPLVQSAVEMYGIVYLDKTGEPHVHICTLGGAGDYERARETIERRGESIPYDKRGITQNQINLLSRFSNGTVAEKRDGLADLLKELEGGKSIKCYLNKN